MVSKQSLLSGLARLSLYYGALLVVALLIWLAVHRHGRQTGEWFRKLLHTIQFCSILPLTLGFQNWLEPVIVEVSLCLIIALLLLLLERIKPGLFGMLINERHKNEGIVSLFLSFGTMTALIAVFWGGFGIAYRPVILVGVLTWGCSDMAAALVGTRFGRHHPHVRWIDSKKSWEGSSADAMVSFLVSFWISHELLENFYGGSLWAELLIPFAAALVSASVELISRGGMDTVTVPVAVSSVTFALLKLLEGASLSA